MGLEALLLLARKKASELDHVVDLMIELTDLSCPVELDRDALRDYFHDEVFSGSEGSIDDALANLKISVKPDGIGVI